MLQNTGRTRFKKGNIPWHKGKKGIYSKETLQIMSDKAKGKKNPHTPEWNKKISESLRGKKSPNWKGGIYKTNNDSRRSGEYKLWRKECLERDNFTCQKYGISGGQLEIHHINNFSEFPELRFKISNGITLSKKAHREFHKKYGKKNNTREQINEFLNLGSTMII